MDLLKPSALIGILLCLFTSSSILAAEAATVDESELKAAFLVHFGNYVGYPTAAFGAEEDEFLVYNEGDTFKVKASKKVATVRIYDINGHTVIEAHPRNISFDVFQIINKFFCHFSAK